VGEAAAYRAKDHMQKGYYVKRHSLLPIRQKTTCKRGTVWHAIPCCPWEEEVNPWVCGWC